MNFPLFIAKRLYAHRGEGKRVSRPAIQIATAGIAVGLAVMIVSVCVVLGFKREIRDKVIGFGSHIQVLNYRALQSLDSYPISFDDSLLNSFRQLPGLSHVQRFTNKPGMLKTSDEFKGIVLKGIGPEYQLDFIKENLIAGEIPNFSDSVAGNQLLISQTQFRDNCLTTQSQRW